MKRLLFLTISDRKGASGRYRVYQYVPLLEREGFDVTVLPPAPRRKGWSRLLDDRREKAAILRAAGSADVIVIQKRLFAASFVKQLARLGKPIVFDLDDAVFRSARGDRSAATRRRVSQRFETVLCTSTLVVAGNAFLADHAKRHAARVEIVPTTVDVKRYHLKQHEHGAGCALGWIGGRATQVYLDGLKPVLASLPGEIPDVKLVVVSDADFDVPGLNVECRRWSEAAEVDDILSFDIGLMPLEDNDWTKGKCALKALQYMAAGVPVVSSPVGVAADVIRDGIDGILCRTDNEWREGIKRLAADAVLRQNMGREGRNRVEKAYSIERGAARLADLLRSL